MSQVAKLFKNGRSQAVRLPVAIVDQLLSAFEVLPWTSATAQRYGTIRAELETHGKTLSPLDLMIAGPCWSTTPRDQRPRVSNGSHTQDGGLGSRLSCADQAAAVAFKSRRAFSALAAMV